MKAEIKGDNLIVTIPINEPKLSKSEKTMVIASSGGNKETEAVYKGKKVIIGLNAYFKN